jgi:hypothetical protein
VTISRRYDVHYSHLDALLVDCVHPIVLRHRDRVRHASWERHFAGGPHLRIRLQGDDAEVDVASAELLAAVERFLHDRPSPDVAYSPALVSSLLQREGSPVENGDDITYRNDVVIERTGSAPHGVSSPDAVRLLEDFQHDCMPVAGRILDDTRPRRESVLRLYFLHALIVGGDLPKGSVSWRSHWEGLASSWPSARVIERIRETYDAQRDPIRRLMLEVLAVHDAKAWAEDAVLSGWRELALAYRQRIRTTVKDAGPLTRQPVDVEEARRFRAGIENRWHRESAFLKTFCADEEFLVSIQHAPSMLVSRVLVNLFYVLVAAVGLTPLDKFSLCYFAHRSVEEHFDCDLRTILERNMAKVKDASARRGVHVIV